MEGLKPSTTYYYRVGGDSSKINPWSEIYSFTTVTPGKSLTFAILADMAYDNISDDTVAALIDLTASGEVDCVIHSGDISYADGFEPHWVTTLTSQTYHILSHTITYYHILSHTIIYYQTHTLHYTLPQPIG